MAQSGDSTRKNIAPQVNNPFTYAVVREMRSDASHAESIERLNIERLYKERFPKFLRVAEAIIGEQEAARDAVQEAFIRALRHRRKFRGDGPLEGWVWRIVVNEARRVWIAKSRVQARTTENTSDGHVPERVPDGDLRALIVALPERQRLAIFLRYYADLDYAAIGEALDVESGTVSATLHAAHSNLRRALEEVAR